MPLTRVQGPTNVVANANVTTLSATWPSTPTPGNLLICCACSDATANMTSTGWTLVQSAVNNCALYQWAKIATAGESATVVIGPTSAADTVMTIEEYSGQLSGAIATVIDKVASQAVQAATTTPVSGTTTATAQADEQAIACIGNDTTSSGYSAWTNAFVETSDIFGAGASTATLAMGVAEKALAATGTQSTSATGGSASSYSGLIATYKAAVVSLGPTLVSYTEIPYNSLTTPRSSASISWQAGDVIVVISGSEGSGTETMSAPTATGLTFTQRQNRAGASAPAAGAWTAVAGSSGSSAVAAGCSNSVYWGASIWVWRGSNGVGITWCPVGSTALTVSQTPTAAHSGFCWAAFDWNAVAPTGTGVPTPTTTEESALEVAGHYSAYAFDLVDLASATSQAFGISAYTGAGPLVHVGVEVLGTTSGSPPPVYTQNYPSSYMRARNY